jgi:Mrp family chromosome partitioning ATPase
MAAVFGALGFIAAIIVAFWRSERTRVVNGADDASGSLDAPLLGVISTNGPRTPAAAAPVVTAPDSAAAREHHFIASKLALLGGDSEPRMIMVTSPGETPGKSVAALNLALSTALDHRTVILADVDAKGWLTDLLGARGKIGISDLLARSAYGDVVIDDCVAAVDEFPKVDAFRFIPAGSAAGEGGGTTAGAQMSKLLARLLQEADVVVLDGAAFLEAPAATRLAADADSVVLVVPRGTKAEDLQKTTELIHLARTAPAGYIFDRSRAPGRWRLWPRLYQPIAAKLSRS